MYGLPLRLDKGTWLLHVAICVLVANGVFFFFAPFIQAEKAEREARDLKGTMRKRMEFLDFD